MEDGGGYIRQPGCILQLLNDIATDEVVVVVEEQGRTQVKDLGKRYLCHWTVIDVNGDHNIDTGDWIPLGIQS